MTNPTNVTSMKSTKGSTSSISRSSRSRFNLVNKFLFVSALLLRGKTNNANAIKKGADSIGCYKMEIPMGPTTQTSYFFERTTNQGQIGSRSKVGPFVNDFAFNLSDPYLRKIWEDCVSLPPKGTVGNCYEYK